MILNWLPVLVTLGLWSLALGPWFFPHALGTWSLAPMVHCAQSIFLAWSVGPTPRLFVLAWLIA